MTMIYRAGIVGRIRYRNGTTPCTKNVLLAVVRRWSSRRGKKGSADAGRCRRRRARSCSSLILASRKRLHERRNHSFAFASLPPSFASTPPNALTVLGSESPFQPLAASSSLYASQASAICRQTKGHGSGAPCKPAHTARRASQAPTAQRAEAGSAPPCAGSAWSRPAQGQGTRCGASPPP